MSSTVFVQGNLIVRSTLIISEILIFIKAQQKEYTIQVIDGRPTTAQKLDYKKYSNHLAKFKFTAKLFFKLNLKSSKTMRIVLQANTR